jgi:hypothetical protein
LRLARALVPADAREHGREDARGEARVVGVDVGVEEHGGEAREVGGEVAQHRAARLGAKGLHEVQQRADRQRAHARERKGVVLQSQAIDGAEARVGGRDGLAQRLEHLGRVRHAVEARLVGVHLDPRRHARLGGQLLRD